MMRNVRHEMFCQKLIEYNGNQLEAYLAVYPKSSRRSARANAARLKAKDSVRGRLEEILTGESGLFLKAVKTLSNVLDAQKPIKQGGKIVYIQDYETQFEGAFLAAKLLGMVKD